MGSLSVSCSEAKGPVVCQEGLSPCNSNAVMKRVPCTSGYEVHDQIAVCDELGWEYIAPCRFREHSQEISFTKDPWLVVPPQFWVMGGPSAEVEGQARSSAGQPPAAATFSPALRHSSCRKLAVSSTRSLSSSTVTQRMDRVILWNLLEDVVHNWLDYSFTSSQVLLQ